MARRALCVTLAAALGALSCVEQAVLENDVRRAMLSARVLRTADDLALAQAALSSELIELEVLYQRGPRDRRVLALLARGYALLARGFIEIERLRAASEGEDALVAMQAARQERALSRAHYYAGKHSTAAAERERLLALPELELTAAETACRARDRSAYERALSQELARRPADPEARLERALAQRMAQLWLTPPLVKRCGF